MTDHQDPRRPDEDAPSGDLPPAPAEVPPGDTAAPPEGDAPPPPGADETPPPPPPGGAGSSPPPGGEAAPPPAAPGAGPRELRRVTGEGRVLGGVAGGIARYLGIDPVVVRVAFVLLVFTFLALPLYLFAWLVIPPDDGRESAAESTLAWIGTAPTWVKVVLGAVAVLFVLPGTFGGDSGLFWGLVLIGLGVVLFRRNAGVAAAGVPAGATGAVPPAAGGTGPPPGGGPGLAAGTSAGAAAASSLTPSWGQPSTTRVPLWTEPVPAPPREPSLLGRLTIAAILIGSGIGALLHLVGVADFTLERFLALSLALTGLGLVVGGWWGRARGLIVLGVLVLPMLLAANLFTVPDRGGIGERVYRPQSLSEVDEDYRLFMGSTEIDLSAVDFSGTTSELEASVGFGELIIVVPPDVSVEVDSRVRGGVIELFGETVNGTEVELRGAERGEEGGGRLRIDTEVGFGSVVVEQDRSDPDRLDRDGPEPTGLDLDLQRSLQR